VANERRKMRKDIIHNSAKRGYDPTRPQRYGYRVDLVPVITLRDFTRDSPDGRIPSRIAYNPLLMAQRYSNISHNQ